jgi:peptidoglycan/xylan/chitin deacetylase (PgdA/CDA1 family)
MNSNHKTVYNTFPDLRFRQSPDRSLGLRILSYTLGEGAEVENAIPNFESHLRSLADQGYAPASLNDVISGKPGSDKRIVITFDQAEREELKKILPVLKEYGYRAAIFLTADKVDDPASLSVKEIHTLHKGGFEFGSRGLSGRRLRGMGRDEKWKEIFGSKHYLEDLLGFKIDFFCYPWGDYDEEAVRLARQAAYSGACSNLAGLNKRVNRFLLRRTEVLFMDNAEIFKRKLAGAYDLFYMGLQWVKGMAA